MSIPKYLMVLANHKGPAIVKVGGMALPVKIMDIEHASNFGISDETTFKCLVVNEDQINYWNRDVATAADVARNKSFLPPKPSYTYVNPFQIVRVIFSNPATIVFWADGTKTVVKCQEGDVYSEETGLAMAIVKKVFGNKGNFNEVFKKFIPGYDKREATDEMPEL